MKIYEVVGLNEIDFGALPNPTVPEELEIDNYTKEGKFDNYEIVSVHIDKWFYFILDSNSQYMGYVILGNNDEFLELYVAKRYRRMGIASSIILFLLRKLNKKLKLMPDMILSKDSREVLSKLAEVGKVKVSSNNGYLSKEQATKVFADESPNDIALVIECRNRNPDPRFLELWNPTTGFAGSSNVWIGESFHPLFWYD